MPKIIITADDLGIDPNINKAIVKCYKEGILTSSALLVNAPFSKEGIEIAKSHPGLEVGLHLSIVEGLSLRGKKSSVTDQLCYFCGICLIRDWKHFLKKYFLGKINLHELEEELELQILEFLKHFPSIPFINGTQHMHLIPGVWKIVLKLAKKYNVKAVRVPSVEFPNSLYVTPRVLPLISFNFLGEMARFSLQNSNIKTSHKVIGLQFSGQLSETVLMKILKTLKPETVSEIVMHPGYASTMLRTNLPWAYTTFDWDVEREALLSTTVKEYISKKNIQLIKYSNL